MHNKRWSAAGIGLAGLLLAACGSGSGGTALTPATHPAASGGIHTASTSIGTVLVNSSGRTLYWFAIDTATKSNCNGSCASIWPPLTTKAAGVTLPHALGTIKRQNGQSQVTYDGHPLYTFTSDSAAGQTHGNGISSFGGRWYAITPSGAKLAAKAAPSPSGSSSSGSGYGGY